MSYHTSLRTGRRNGSISLGGLLALLVIGAVVMALYLFVPPYFGAWKLSSLLRGVCVKAENLETAEQVKDYAIAELGKQDFHFKPEQIKVTHVDRVTTLDLNYVETVRIPFTDVEFQISFEKHATNAAEN